MQYVCVKMTIIISIYIALYRALVKALLHQTNEILFSKGKEMLELRVLCLYSFSNKYNNDNSIKTVVTTAVITNIMSIETTKHHLLVKLLLTLRYRLL